MTGSDLPRLTLLPTPDAALCVGDACDIPAAADRSADGPAADIPAAENPAADVPEDGSAARR